MAVAEKLPIGESVLVGKVRGRIVRHFEDGVAIEFSALQTIENLEKHLN